MLSSHKSTNTSRCSAKAVLGQQGFKLTARELSKKIRIWKQKTSQSCVFSIIYKFFFSRNSKVTQTLKRYCKFLGPWPVHLSTAEHIFENPCLLLEPTHKTGRHQTQFTFMAVAKRSLVFGRVCKGKGNLFFDIFGKELMRKVC